MNKRLSYSSELKDYLKTLGFRKECCMLACSAGYEAEAFEPTCDRCTGCYLRGVFFRFGYITPPEKDPLLTLDFNDDYAFFVQDVLHRASIDAKVTVRRGHNLIYLKKTDAISDFVTMIGASKYALRLMELQVDKQFRSELNRKVNAETANLTRTANAAAEQLAAIGKLQKSELWETLPEPLLAAAELRLAHPEASLEELRALSSPPVSKSGLNHRLQKLARIAAELP